MGRYIDLHIHSKYSDGALTPKEILDEAEKINLKMVSIADHDSIDNLAEVKKELEERPNLLYVPGVEISSHFVDRKNEQVLIHILGYGFDEENTKLLELLSQLEDIRTKVNEKYIEQLLLVFKEISEQDLENVDRKKYYRIGREVIRHLKATGKSEELLSEVKRYSRKNMPVYQDYDAEASRVVDTIHSAGGLAILAHPTEYRLRDIELKRMMKKLIDMGIEGIETNYADTNIESMEKLRMMAESYKILFSAGSDFHFYTETDTKYIGYGINNNLCIESCSLADKVIEKKLCLKGSDRIG